MFIIERCVRRFRRAWRYYIWIVLELAAGISIVVCQDSVVIAVRDRLAVYERQFMEDTVSVNSYFTGDVPWGVSELPITYEDYLFFCQEVPKDTELYYMQYGNVYLGIEQISLLGMSSNKFQQLLGFPMEDTVWIGWDALKRIEAAEAFAGQYCSIRGEMLCLHGAVFPYRVLGEDIRNHSLINFNSGADDDIRVAECIFVPVELAAQIEEPLFFHSTLETGGAGYRQTAEKIADSLAERSTVYQYEVADRRQVYLKSSKDLSDDIKLVSCIGRVALLLTAVGIIGIMLIHLDERKKDFAISMVAGATKRRLVAETVLEILALCLCGGIAALGISAVTAPMLSTSKYLVSLKGHSISFLTAIVFGMAILVCLVLFSCVKIKEPVKALREVVD